MVTKENVAIIIPFHKNIEMLRLSIHTLEESIIEEKPQIIIIANSKRQILRLPLNLTPLL